MGSPTASTKQKAMVQPHRATVVAAFYSFFRQHRRRQERK
jgi:hypothetical protein